MGSKHKRSQNWKTRPAARLPDHASIAADSDRLLRLLGVASDHAIFLLDPEGHITTWSPRAERLTGYRSSEVLGHSWSLLLPPEAVRAGKAKSDLAIARAASRLEEEGWQVRKEGSRFWAELCLTAIFDDAGRIWGYSRTVRDLTERRNAAEALFRSEERLRLMVEAVQDHALVMLDPGGRVETWNAGAERLTGYQASEIVGRPFNILYTPEDLATGKPERELRTAAERGRVEEEGWKVRKDGTRFWANAVVGAVRDETGHLRGFAKVIQDMTERRRADELAAARSRENTALARLGVLALRTPEVSPAVQQAVRTVSETLEVERVELLELAPDGETLVAQAAGILPPELAVPGAIPASRETSPAGLALATGEPVLVENLREDGRFHERESLLRSGVVSVLSVPVQGESLGTRHGVLSVYFTTRRVFHAHEVDFLSAVANVLATAVARVRAEERVRQAERAAESQRLRLARAEERVRERDEFLSVAAHELRTPLTALQLRLESLQQGLRRKQEDGGGLEGLVEQARRTLRNVARLASLVERLLDVSRIASGRMTLRREPADLARLAEEVVEEIRQQATGAGTPLVLELRAHPRAEVDLLRMEQVLTNLLGNAIKYGAGQPVEIIVDQRGGEAVLTVQDHGIGIAREDRERIFDRFERAAPSGRYGGLGLGLYITRRVVDAHGGSINVRSEPGRGAAFEVTLPLAMPTPSQLTQNP